MVKSWSLGLWPLEVICYLFLWHDSDSCDTEIAGRIGENEPILIAIHVAEICAHSRKAGRRFELWIVFSSGVPETHSTNG
jgi:hypothetical protein